MRSSRLIKARLNALFQRANDATSEMLPNQLSSLLSDLETEFQSYQRCMDEVCIENNQESAIAEYLEYEGQHSLSKQKLLALQHQTTVKSQTSSSIEEFLLHQKGVLDAISSNQSVSRSSSSFLPQIHIPGFTGNISSWVTFRDLFTSTVHLNNELTNIQRFQYLRSYVSGQAESLIKTIQLTDANYPIAWKTLLEHYDNDFLVTESIFDRFFNCQKVGQDHHNLRDTYNTFRETFEMLDNLGEYAQSRDPLAIFLMLRKLDKETDVAWARKARSNKVPKIKEFLDFLKQQCEIYDLSHKTDQSSKKPLKLNSVQLAHTFNCFKCGEGHSIYKCQKFGDLSLAEREKFIFTEGRCFNCFSKGHKGSECQSKHRCFVCKKAHNTLLHPPSSPVMGVRSNTSKSKKSNLSAELKQRVEQSDSPASSDPSSVVKVNTSMFKSSSILPTALVSVLASDGRSLKVRALLDTGAQSSFISEELFSRLGLCRCQERIPISWFSDGYRAYSKGKATITAKSCHNSNEISTTVHILSKLSGVIPSSLSCVRSIDAISNQFQLADPLFFEPSEISIIFGASVFFSVLKSSTYFVPEDRLFLQETSFGFVACSKENSESELSLNIVSVGDVEENCDQLVERFWSFEEIPNAVPPLSQNERACEELFSRTTFRMKSGRFCVRLPFKEVPFQLGSSDLMAMRRFHVLERKFKDNDSLRLAYVKFMEDYLSLGHMIPAQFTLENLPKNHYFIPHHGIFQAGPSGEEKLRVVFDASAKSSTGVSLNDNLHVGPKLQIDLWKIVLSFRKYRYVLTADIEKMYRQILIDSEDTNYQLIFWRASPDEPIKIFKLLTVTYGEACSPYLALRVLQELSNQEGHKFPLASGVLGKCRYVDDLLFGHDDKHELMNLKVELVNLLKRGCFCLKKWASNTPDLLEDCSAPDLADPLLFSDREVSSDLKTLGIVWCPQKDSFSYRFSFPILTEWSKRKLLSDSGRLFDPMGWISPITLRFKVLFQETWIRQLKWDSQLPADIILEWRALRDQLSSFNSFNIPRHLGEGEIELHGFADASKIAYAAVVYARVISSNGSVSCSLLMAKTKLAPIRQISIPRLELCAAHLLARLISQIQEYMKPTATYLYSDSTTVIAWIRSMPRKWSTFVGNRIGHIHDLCPKLPWLYVKSVDNPADIASRGASPSQLWDQLLWWNGPEFLLNFEPGSSEHIEFSTDEEAAPLKISAIVVRSGFWDGFLSRFSKFSRMINTLCYVLRTRGRLRRLSSCHSGELSAEETKVALQFIILQFQKDCFGDVISHLRSRKPLPRTSELRTLDPYLDSDGVLRVGGRLRNFDCSFFESNPIILPRSRLSDLLITKTHLDTLHGGVRVVISHIRQKFWIVGIQKSVKRLIRHCQRCQRYKAETFKPEMGQLPGERVSVSKPFTVTGIDFAGPLILRPFRSRGKISVKGYISVFVCFSTKAIHLELVMNLSTSALVMALQRFIARRGRCEKFVSDNGRNFQGCKTALAEYQKKIQESLDSTEFSNFLSESFIEWSFIPSYAPHFGGLWESAVKSVKTHLSHTFNGSCLTIEEAHTALCRIEGILNSRPLGPISFTDALQPITPAHLLTGEPASHFPTLDAHESGQNDSKLRLKFVRNLVNTFWARWRSEYLDTIIRKPKWSGSGCSPKVGDIVLIKRLHDPPQSWRFAEIIKLYPGKDSVVRVVDVRTRLGTRREAIRNLIPLSVEPTVSTAGSMED